ncbi:MAG TPA: ATP-binding protein [Chryseolinea sp.]
MKKAILFFAMLFIADMAFSQNVHMRDADSLRRELAIAKQDTTRAIILADLAEAYRAAKPDSTLYFADQALQLSRSIDFPFGEMRAYLVLCHYFQFNGIDLPKALETGLKGLDIAVKHHFKDYEAGVSIRLGTVHLTLGNTEEAFNYFRRANKASSDGVHPFFHTVTYYWLSSCYLRMKKSDSALYMAKIGYDKAVALKNDFVLGGALANMARMHATMGNNELAMQYYRQRIAAAERITEYADIAGGYISLANLFRKINQNDSAIYYAKKAYDLYRPRLFSSVTYPARLLSELLEPTDPAEALRYLKIAEAAKDSANNIQKMQLAQSLVFKEKERQTELGYERRTYQSKVRQYALLAGIGLLLLVLVGLYRNNRIKQKANRALEMQKKRVEETLAELKSTQVQLIQSEKMASLGELTAGIAHEIQNPLNFVNNFSEVNTELIKDLKSEIQKGNLEEVKALASDIELNEGKINQHGKRAEGIVKSMLQHSQKSSGQKELTDINALCDEYLRLSFHGYRAKDKSFNAKFETDFDSALPRINVVPQDIGRVVLNLINNAFYAVALKHSRRAEAAAPADNSYQPTVRVSTRKLNNQIEISVKDNGNGIPDSIKEKIFQPFFTTKPTGQGTGLGLSLSYDIVKAHGGTIEVSSEEGLRTEFRIQIPITD